MEIRNTNRCFMRFEDRAERITPKQVADTFVTVGPLMELLDSRNNQILYGRRGTGKTHALRYLESKKNASGDLAIFVDAQSLGSNGSIYNDTKIDVSERATRLLVDICATVHAKLLDIFTAPNAQWDLSEVIPLMDNFVSGFTGTRISGDIEEEIALKSSDNVKTGASAGIESSLQAMPKLTASLTSEQSGSAEKQKRIKIVGKQETLLNFQYFAKAMKALAEHVRPRRIWILIDEWTTVHTEIQPYLADLLRRSMFPISNVTTKIAAIEHRASFKLERVGGGYIGFELGADVSASINLDDYLVVDNNEQRALDFFRNFITNHVVAVAEELKIDIGPVTAVVASAFTQENVFGEFVRATEGVPRDAMRILALAAQRSNAVQISMPTVRSATHAFFQTEKYETIQANAANRALLDWIRDEVISERRTRAFLLRVGINDPIIDRLFDYRALHILNRSRSAAHRPGERFVVYKLDYGLYVDLANTDKFPNGLLLNEAIGRDVDFDVPADDARSFRRAILDLGRFYESHPEFAVTSDQLGAKIDS